MTLSKRYAALLEVLIVTLILIFVIWISEACLGYMIHGIFLDFIVKTFIIFVVLLAIVIPKRNFKIYGFLPKNLYFTFKWSIVFMIIFILPAVISIIISIILGIAKPAKLSLLAIILNIVFFMIFVGFIEEAYFRGYVQSRLNEAFDKRHRKLIFKAWRVNYGTSLFLTSVIFALMHIVNYWNPIMSKWEPTWWMPIHILGCFAFGCIVGALREASDIYVSSSLHGSIMIAYTFLSIYTNEWILNISLFISWFIFFNTLTFFFHRSKKYVF